MVIIAMLYICTRLYDFHSTSSYTIPFYPQSQPRNEAGDGVFISLCYLNLKLKEVAYLGHEYNSTNQQKATWNLGFPWFLMCFHSPHSLLGVYPPPLLYDKCSESRG